MAIDIRSFQYGKRQADELWQFDCDLYRSDDLWIPPFRRNYRLQFSATSLRDGDHHNHFVAVQNGEVVGHVSAWVNHRLHDHDERVGSMGNFECVADGSVAGALFRSAQEWLQTKHSIRRIWAPFNADIWHGYRLKTRGFGLAPFVGEPQNHAYYPSFFQQFGFTVRQRWQTVELVSGRSIEELQRDSKQRYSEIIRDGYRFVPLNGRRPEQIHELAQLIIHSYHGFLGFTQPAAGTLERQLAALGRMTDTRYCCLAYDAHDKVCGFAVAYPDQSAAVRAMRGRAGVGGRLRFLAHRKRDDQRFIFYLIGITPDEYQRHHGLGRAIFYATLDKVRQCKFSSLLLAIIANDSPSRRLAGRWMDTANREYVLYEMVT